MAELQGDPFYVAFQGSFVGVMQWEQLDALWSTLRNDAAGGWYLYAVGETPPVSSAKAWMIRQANGRIFAQLGESLSAHIDC